MSSVRLVLVAHGMPERYDATTGEPLLEHSTSAAAVPAALPAGTADNGSFRFVVDVDGERFAAYQYADGGWNYEWLTGPNEGYGFGRSGPPIASMDEHRQSLRDFLQGIDPATGYLADS